MGGTQVRLARGKQKSDSDDLDPTLDPVPQQCVRKTFSASFVPQPVENNTYKVVFLDFCLEYKHNNDSRNDFFQEKEIAEKFGKMKCKTMAFKIKY